LTLSGSTLYGATFEGGAYRVASGVVFSLPVSGGVATVLTSFDGSINGITYGANPVCSLTLIGSTLFGTGQAGGTYGYGTFFGLPVSVGTNWGTGSAPNGAGCGAVINASTSAAVTITLDEPAALGTLLLGNSASTTVGYTLNGAGSNTLTLNNSGSGTTITVTDGTHAINAPVILADNLVVTTGSTNSWTLSFGTASSITDNGGGYSVTMSGSCGTLIISGSNTYTGGTFINGGIVSLANSAALPVGLDHGNGIICRNWGGLPPK